MTLPRLDEKTQEGLRETAAQWQSLSEQERRERSAEAKRVYDAAVEEGDPR